jgi:hypothetical protein
MESLIRDRLGLVLERVARSAERAGRKPEEITLIGVCKAMPATLIREAYEAGLRDFGENYVQEFAAKRAELGEMPGAVFHMIGHLQSNKAGPAAELFDVIQTVDTVKLARRLHESGKPLRVLIEVKLGEEETKSGVAPEGLPALIEAVQGFDRLDLRGLMVIPPWTEQAETSRPYFRRLRQLAEPYGLPELSMGMSNDFEVAIEEGATLVRVGTAIFGPRKAKA